MKKNGQEQFLSDLGELHIFLSDRQLSQFMRYYELLTEWNSFMNLTAITDFDDVCKKHFVDSVSLIKAVDLTGNLSVIDIGTGAGFPGIPLKIVFPDLSITLLDSLNKRIQFLNAVICELGLSDITALHGRAEDYSKPGKLRESFDLCVSRAVANLSTLSEYCLPYVKTGGCFLSYKSEKVGEESRSAKRAIELLGGEPAGQTDFFLPDSNIYRVLYKINKIKETPGRYPRKAGLPSREPL